MAITTMTSREFNQDAGRAKRAAASGPVFITDRGRPAHVLLTAEQYQALIGKRTSLADVLAMPAAAAIAFEPPRSRARHRPADLG
jgi:PHD/YefM family antitoxin component YafN of YafNO toxin-antitoxin module